MYVHGNRVDEIAWSYNTFTGEQAFHHYDARGHCTLLTDSAGNILEQYEYDAFGWPYFYDASGNPIGAIDPVQHLWEGYSLFGNRFLFTGREWISDLKLYDYRNRLYQPELGRFLQPDPIGFGGEAAKERAYALGFLRSAVPTPDYNLYRYCHNDPVNRSDPMGLFDRSNDDPEKARPVLVADTYRMVLGSNIPVHIQVFNSGNWNDSAIGHHASSNLQQETGKGGITLPQGSSSVSGNNVSLTMHVDWYYDKKYEGTNVITRELQHVQDARNLERGYWSGGKAASLGDLRNFSGIVKGFTIMQKLNYDQTKGPHDLGTYPAVPTNVPEFDPTR